MKTSLKDIKRMARGILTGHMAVPIRAMLTAALLPLLLEYPFASMLNTAYSTTFQTILYFIAVFFLGVIGEVLAIGRCLVHICMARGEAVAPSYVFYAFKNRSNHYFIGALLLQTISFIAALPLSYALTTIDLQKPDPASLPRILIIFSATALIRLLIRVFFGLFYYVALDYEEETIAANLRMTFSLLKGRFFQLLLLNLSFLGLEFLAMLSFCIGYLWVSPYKEQAITMFYLDAHGQLTANKTQES